MLRAITERIAKTQEYLHEIKDVCERISAHTDDPPPWMIALPIIYRRVGLRNEETGSIDPRIYDMAGMYLCKRFPELSEYFASKGAIERVRSMQEEVLNVIDEAKRRDTHAENGNVRQAIGYDGRATQATQTPETTQRAHNNDTVTHASITTGTTVDNIVIQAQEEEKGFQRDLARVRELLQQPVKR